MSRILPCLKANSATFYSGNMDATNLDIGHKEGLAYLVQVLGKYELFMIFLSFVAEAESPVPVEISLGHVRCLLYLHPVTAQPSVWRLVGVREV